jgi:hypothetical protein
MTSLNPVRNTEKKLRIHVSKHGDLKTEKYLELVNNIVLAKLQVEEQLALTEKILEKQSSRNERSRINALTDDEILEEDFEKNAEANAIANAVNSLIIATEKNALRNKKRNKKKKEKAKAKKAKLKEDSPPKDILPCLDTVLAHIENLERLD